MSKKFLLFIVLTSAGQLYAQDSSSRVPVQTQTIPKLTLLISNIYGPNGMFVDSDEVLPDGSTHSGHYNSAFQEQFTPFNIAIASQLTALPIPSPASGFTYTFDSSTGTYKRSTQSFGPILAERAETIGKGKFSFGFSYQYFRFESIDGTDLTRVPAVFQHDDAELGGGRVDIITTINTITTSVAQITPFLTFGITDRIDLSVAVPLVQTHLSLLSDAVIQRIGTTDPKIHFFLDPADPTNYGNEKLFSAKGTAAGLGDIIVRVKGTVIRNNKIGLALGTDVRVPSGDEKDLLGSGAIGVKPFAAVSMLFKRVSPHINAAYQWNGKSELAGDVKTGIKADLPDQILYVAGVDIGISGKLTLALDYLGQTVLHSPKLIATTFIAANGEPFPSITFQTKTFNQATVATGIKMSVAKKFLVDFNLLTSINKAGLRAKVTPLIGFEYSY